ncbi:MAG: LytTR family DNA-binding domain-containing protein [Clostridia bacterium]|nr:LytTR family DNA-binding domain-containing protein [Clostridia bacterium]
MRKLRIALCEDEATQREFYRALCVEAGERHSIKAEVMLYKNGNDLLFDLEDPMYYNTLDLLFLDIAMPGLDGVDTAKAARRIGYTGVIVFITASKAHYESAFDVGAFHYLTKGEHNWERFEEIFLKAVAQAESRRQENVVLPLPGGDIQQVQVQDILYFEMLKGVLTAHCETQSYECVSTLEKLESELKKYGFQRVHRSYVLCLLYVKSISYQEVIMQNGTALPVGRKFYPELKEAIRKMKV